MGMAPRTQTTTQTTTPDAGMMGYRDEVWNAARGAANAPGVGLSPWTTQAGDLFGQYAQSGAQGAAALGGDQGAMRSFLNPFQSQVMDDLQGRFAGMARQVSNGVNDEATRAGAFGGMRHGVASGVAQANLARDTQSQLANLSMQGYGDAMNRAYMSANLGMGAGSQLAGLGQYARGVAVENDPAMRRFSLLQAGMAGAPTGQTSTQSKPLYSNPWATGFGLLSTGLGLATGMGWAPLAGAAGSR
jgi:hypothetical protein